MKKLLNPLFLTVSLFFLFSQAYSQIVKESPGVTSQGKGSTLIPGYAIQQWTVNNPFEQKVFIENNEGQFNGKTPYMKDKILFSTRINEVYLYFSATGITYRYDKYTSTDNDGKELKNDKDALKPVTHFFSVKWKGANQNPTVIAEDQAGFYYTYPHGNKHTTIAHAFKKLLYKNIYPGIDIEYSLPDEKKGLEYSLIVHPGANLSLVKMLYPDAKNLSIHSGNIESQSSFGTFIDYAPSKTYYLNDPQALTCSFLLSANVVSFLANYDHSKTLIIDPWMVNPGFTNFNAGYDVCYDLRGNVYAYGSFAPYEEIKINSNGAIKWIFSIPNSDPQYADFAVDEATGISYDGSCTNPTIYKVDTAGLQTASFVIGNTMEELWRMAFNKCENKLILAGGGVGLINQVCTLDTSLATLNAVNVLNAGEGHNDMSLLAIDNDNSSIYMAVAGNLYNALYPNDVLRVMLPSLAPTQYLVPDGFSFTEGLPDANYIDGVSGHTIAMNGAISSPNWLYFYDGATLKRYHKNTGVTALTKTISNTQYTWGGIDVDLCDNLYLAKSDTIMVYDSSLTNIGKILAPNTVYDLHIAPNNILVASGLHFVSTFSIVTNPVSVSFKNIVTSCSNGTGRATAVLNGCGNDSSTYSYQWSNGETTQIATGLSPGTYSVIISSNCDFAYSDSVTIGKDTTGGMSLTISQNNASCYGEKNGSAIATASGGISPYTYSWSPLGGTNSLASNLSAGTYTVTIKDAPGCIITDSVTITQPPKIIATLSGNDSICAGDSEILTVTGGGTYLWSTSQTTSSISVTVSATKTYSCTITKGGCNIDTSITINVKPNISIKLALLNDSICKGDSALLTAAGGLKYRWSNGSTNNSIIVNPTTTTSYTLYASNVCNNDTIKSTIYVFPPPVPLISGKDTICKGQSAQLTASGGVTYLWNNGVTSNLIKVSPLVDTTYSVKVSNGLCAADTTIQIIVKTVNGIISGPSTICIGDTVVLNASGGGTYLWNNGETSSSITIRSNIDSIVSVAISNNGCTINLKTRINILTPSLYACCDTVITSGDSVHLNASGGYVYNWTPPIGLSCTTCQDPIASPTVTTTYTVTGTDSAGCEVARVVTIYVEPNCKDLLLIPNVFTPNGDGINDEFVINASYTSAYSIEIYDRWGIEIYHSTDPNKYWDGTTNDKTVPAGVYYYIIRATCQNTNYMKDGFVQVIR